METKMNVLIAGVVMLLGGFILLLFLAPLSPTLLSFGAYALRKEHFLPELTDRRSYEAWLKNGAKDIVKRAKEKVKTILEKHRPKPLERDAAKEIKEIIKRAEKDLSP